MIFGPARRRLRALETAARQLGSGDLTARAPDRGGDEIAAVASAFNAMADDLVGARRGARRVRSGPAPAARRRLARADDAGHRDARLSRDADDAGADARRGDARALPRDHQRRDEPARAADRRAAGSGAARRRRRRSLQTARVPVAELFDRVAARHERALQSAGVTLQTSIDPARARGRRRSRSAGAGAAEPRGQRDPLRAARQRAAAVRAARRPAASSCRSRTKAPRGSPPNTCRTSSTASTRRTRRGPGSQAEAGWDCRS